MQAIFNDSRLAVATKLRSLAAGGCQVRVVTGGMETRVKSKLNHPNIIVRRAAVHDKTILINAKYESTSNRYIVFTGSHNLSLSALKKNDELLLKLADSSALHTKFVEHFTRAWNNSSYVTGGSS